MLYEVLGDIWVAEKKLFPKNFDELLKRGDLAELKAVFDACEVDGARRLRQADRAGVWRLPRRARDLARRSGGRRSPRPTSAATRRSTRARSWRGNLQILIDLGADVNSEAATIGTPLHAAADSHKGVPLISMR